MRPHSRSPQVSIIIPAFNAERFIGRALRSVIGQSYVDGFEIIVVDDCSTDRTAFALDLFKEEITLLRNEVKRGLPGSLNRAIEVETRFLVAILCAVQTRLVHRVIGSFR